MIQYLEVASELKQFEQPNFGFYGQPFQPISVNLE